MLHDSEPLRVVGNRWYGNQSTTTYADFQATRPPPAVLKPLNLSGVVVRLWAAPVKSLLATQKSLLNNGNLYEGPQSQRHELAGLYFTIAVIAFVAGALWLAYALTRGARLRRGGGTEDFRMVGASAASDAPYALDSSRNAGGGHDVHMTELRDEDTPTERKSGAGATPSPTSASSSSSAAVEVALAQSSSSSPLAPASDRAVTIHLPAHDSSAASAADNERATADSPVPPSHDNGVAFPPVSTLLPAAPSHDGSLSTVEL